MNTTKFIAQPGSQEMHISHIFDAPIDLVFKTWIDPATIPQWWGPACLATTVEYMEAKTGGSYRIVQRAPDGKVHRFHGVYHSIEAPHRIVSTFEYEGAPGHVSLDTLTFEAQGTQTKYIGRTVFQSVSDRDAMLQAECESGVRETMERMDKLLQQRKGKHDRDTGQ